MNKKWFYYFIGFLVIFYTLNTQAFADNTEIQEKCFNDLKENISQIGIFESPYSEIKELNYDRLEKSFSRFYKNMSSFGIDLDKPLFEMRLYSFGKQTGYIHPPYSPFAVYSKSEKWDNPTKEYIIAEEYITKPDGKKQFLSCSFMQISADDLAKVKSEDYLYDGEIISVIKTNKNLGYKVWYNENVSFNYNNKVLANWKRLFIYPKDSKNDYFDRYTILDSFPSNRSNNFNFLNPTPFAGASESITDIKSNNGIYIYDTKGNIVNAVSGVKELYPVLKTGNDKIFPLFSYYQAIENNFPNFSKNIALRGEIHFDTLKETMGTKDNSNYAHIWNTILDSNEFIKYMKAKNNGTLKQEFQEGDIAFYQENEIFLGGFENEINNIKNLKVTNSKNATNLESDGELLGYSNMIYYTYGLLVLTILTVSGFIIIIRKK